LKLTDGNSVFLIVHCSSAETQVCHRSYIIAAIDLCATFGMHCSGSFIFNVGEHKESPQLPIWNIAETVTVTSQLTSNAYKDHNKKNDRLS
jgi:hypothetical protein